MSSQVPTASNKFWDPSFTYERRDNGTVLMKQVGDLPQYLPTLAHYLDKWADATPDHTWLARRNKSGEWINVSYQHARTQARSLGAALLSMGLGPNKPLVILSENSLEHALLGIACVYVGIPYAPISPAYSLLSEGAVKLKPILDLLKPGAVFADDGTKFSVALNLAASDQCKVINVSNPISGACDYGSLLTHEPDAADTARAKLTEQHVVKYLFTSGSTGSPKAVINTNGMICSMQAMVRDCYRFLEHKPPIVLDWLPWNHTAAGNNNFYLVMTNGGTYYIDDGRPAQGLFDETVRNLREIACTWYFTVPIGFDLLIKELEKDKQLATKFYSQLDMLFYAGAGMAQHTWDQLLKIGKEVTGGDVLLASGLGSTETAPFALAWTEPDKTAGNVGVPSRGLTMKLVPFENTLELRLKGPSITPGYFGEPEKTAEAFDEEGFYRLGDALRPADPDDYSRGFFFHGRLAENFKLSTGTWVSVGAVRTSLVNAMGGLISDAVIVGENQPQLGALLLLSSPASQLTVKQLDLKITELLNRAAEQSTGSSNRVSRVVVLKTKPSLDKGEITEKGTLNQRALRSNNEHLIEKLYASDNDVFVI